VDRAHAARAQRAQHAHRPQWPPEAAPPLKCREGGPAGAGWADLGGGTILRRMKIDPRSGLTEREVALLRSELLELRQELIDGESAGAPEAALEGEPRGDAADRAELTFEQDLVLQRGEARRRRLRDLEDALARIEAGTYGVDEATGEPIGYERLLREPAARYTVTGQEQHEADIQR
jgi:DnaK suppressor protein